MGQKLNMRKEIILSKNSTSTDMKPIYDAIFDFLVFIERLFLLNAPERIFLSFSVLCQNFRQN